MADEVKDLLLEDYRYRAESLWKSEAGGETRVNLFIGLIALAIPILANLLASETWLSGETLRWIFAGALLALFLMGLVTLGRMISRNDNTDLCKRDLDVIRQTFKDRFDPDGSLLGYYLFGGPAVNGPMAAAGKDKKRRKSGKASKSGQGPDAQAALNMRRRRFGGLTHTVAAINSLLLAGLCASVVYPYGLATMLLVAVIGLAAGFSAQRRYIQQREDNSWNDLHKGQPTHAGGVVFDASGGQIRYLLVRPKAAPKEWVLPKGHIKKGEGHGEVAHREVLEESGVYARPVCYLDRIMFVANDKPVDCKFYLLECNYQGLPHEARGQQWLPYEQALAELTHPENRMLLALAEKQRSGHNSAGG